MVAYPNILDLCSGYGGLGTAVRLVFPESRTVCYVEREIAPARILAARMADGSLDAAPIWSDLRTFDARRWDGCVDIVVAGFPCQPHSIAGHREGVDDDRWILGDILRIIVESVATVAFLENVPGIVSSSNGDSFYQILSGLASIGFDAEWVCLSASDVGAPFDGERWFCLATANRHGLPRIERQWPETRDDGGINQKPLSAEGGVWAHNSLPEPCNNRVDHGTSSGLDIHPTDRVKAGGNGVQPLQAAVALHCLWQRMTED